MATKGTPDAMIVDRMRVASIVLSGITILLGALVSATAGAVPIVKLKAEPVPIAGFPRTGYILGHGTALKAEYSISGTEYGGFPAPLTGIDFYLPTGTRLHPDGFPTCPRSTLESTGLGPRGCPKGSAAGPLGRVTGYVAFGDEIVPETATIEPFYAPGGGLEFFTFGHEPVLLEILSTGRYVNVDREGFGQKLTAQVPLVETVPGAQDASVEKIEVEVGSAIRSKGETIYYGTLPSKCPKGGFTVRSDLMFAGLGGLSPTTVRVSYKAPCPRR